MKHISLLLAALIAVTACTSSQSSTAKPTSTLAVTTDPTTVGPATTTTTTAVSVDPSVPPPVVDLPYLTAVMAKLNLLDLRQLAILERDHKVSAEVVALLRAEYAEPELDNQLTSAGEFFAGPTPNLRPVEQRGPVITTPIRVLSNTAKCLSFLATEDFSLEAASPVPVRTDLVVLRPINRAKDPNRLNSTPWQVSFTIIPGDVARPTASENQCAG